MTAEPLTRPAVLDTYVLRFGGGRVLLASRQSCLDVLRALQAAVAAAGRDGLRTPPRIAALVDALDAELTEVSTSAAGNAELPHEPDVPISVLPAHPADANEAAALLGITPRQVRNLGPRLDGRKVGGTWVFDREALAIEAERRHRERTH